MPSGNLETDHDILLDIRARLDGHAASHQEIQKRLESLEHSRSYVTGAVWAIGAFAAGGWAWMKGWFGLGGSR